MTWSRARALLLAVAVSGKAPTRRVGTLAEVELGETGLKLSSAPEGEGTVRITATKENGTSWVGVGLSRGDVMSMNGDGQGADIVTCSAGQVKRYWVTGYDLSAEGRLVPGASCTQENGKTTLAFSRRVSASGDKEMAVTPGTRQQLIFAYGADGSATQKYHGMGLEARGSLHIDFAGGDVEETVKRRGEWLLYLHLVPIVVGWGGLLPMGAVIANRFGIGLWFAVHRAVQYVGWFVQLIGFFGAVAYVLTYSFQLVTLHSWVGMLVVSIGTLQPLNAYYRPHVPEVGEVTSPARAKWEFIHKGGGWFALIVAPLNMALAIKLLRDKGYDKSVESTALFLIFSSYLLPAGALLASLCSGRGKKSIVRSEDAGVE